MDVNVVGDKVSAGSFKKQCVYDKIHYNKKKKAMLRVLAWRLSGKVSQQRGQVPPTPRT